MSPPPPPPPPPAAAALAWQWVIETLAGLDSVDTALLSGVISAVPDFWTGASEAVRERLALRYLEEFQDSGDAGRVDAGSTSEEVLCSLTRKEVVGLQIHGAELSSDDLRQFILQKKATLPKPSLELLNESFLEGQPGTALFLKEISGLSTFSQVDYFQCNNGGKSDLANMLEFSTDDDQNHSGLQGSITLFPDSSNPNLQEPSGSEKNLPHESLLYGDTRNNVHGNIVCTGGTDVPYLEKSSKYLLTGNIGCNGGEIHSSKQAEMTKHVAAPALDSCKMSLHDRSAPGHNLSEMDGLDCKRTDDVQPKRQSSPSLLPFTQAEMTKHVDTLALDSYMSLQDPCSSRQHLPEISVPDQPIRQCSPPVFHCKQNSSVQHTPIIGSRKNVLQPLRQNEHLDCEVDVVPETPSDGSFSDSSLLFDPDDEFLNSEKERLLRSQIQANPDSVAGKSSEHVLCTKCYRGGQVLSCSSKSCLISVHESCLDTTVNFNGTDLFYCPFCSYTRASIAYCEARKTLSAFIGRDLVKGHRKKLPPVSIHRETTQVGGHEITDQPNSFHSHEDRMEKLNDNQHHGAGDGNVRCGNLSSIYSEAFQSGGYDVSYTTAREMVNHHQEGTYMPPLNTAANLVNNGNLPSGVEVTASLCEKADISVNMHGEEGNARKFNGQPEPRTKDCSLLHEGMGPYDIGNDEATRTPEKDSNCSVIECADKLVKLKDLEQLRAAPEQETWRGVSASLPRKRLANSRSDAVMHGKTKRKRSPSGSSSKHAVAEYQQARVVPDHANNPETLNSQPPVRYAKRKLDATTAKINDPIESVEKPKTRKSSSATSSKHVSGPKSYFGQGIPLGRRHKLFWTSEEEEILKEAIRRFAVDTSGSYPWREILEFGRHVFHTTRQPGDLKDKWRNLKKKEIKQEM